MQGGYISYFGEKIRRTEKYPILCYIYESREFISHLNESTTRTELTEEIKNIVLPIATSSSNYYNRNKNVFKNDISLDTVTTICNFDDAILNVKAEDQNVTTLAYLFNDLVKSSRRLFKCYDCGTNARAIFLKLIEARRGRLCLTDEEVNRLERDYRIDVDVTTSINQLRDFLKRVESDTVVICSIGLGDSGHVWTLEKRIYNDPETGQIVDRYHHYQSCLNSHTVLDFIEHKKYGEDPNQSLDLDKFCDDLITVLSRKEDWDYETNYLFAKNFAYLPYSPVVKPRGSICWTYITYSNLDSIKTCGDMHVKLIERIRRIQNKQQGIE